MGQEGAGPGWVTANRIEGQGSPQDSPFGSSDAHDSQLHPGNQPAGFGANSSQTVPNPSAPEGLSAWFAVEPEGQIQLQLNFGEAYAFLADNKAEHFYSEKQCSQETIRCCWRSWPPRSCAQEERRSPRAKWSQVCSKAVLHRHPLRVLSRVPPQRCWHAMRRLQIYVSQEMLHQRGDQMHHQKQCRNCAQGPYIANHADCIAQDKDEEKINHRIPHRFEPISSLSPSWCCHCGLILPLGRKKARKCSECDLTAHTDCVQDRKSVV